MLKFRWNNDPLCTGPFPSNFESVERTLRDLRKSKYGRSPVTPEEIAIEFQKDNVLRDLGTSLQRDKGPLYNATQIGDNYSNCIFSSAKSISLVKDHLEVRERFFMMDGTFRITPRGVFQQVLVIYIHFGSKVIYKLIGMKS